MFYVERTAGRLLGGAPDGCSPQVPATAPVLQIAFFPQFEKLCVLETCLFY